jgi:hypothetical protein
VLVNYSDRSFPDLCAGLRAVDNGRILVMAARNVFQKGFCSGTAKKSCEKRLGSVGGSFGARFLEARGSFAASPRPPSPGSKGYRRRNYPVPIFSAGNPRCSPALFFLGGLLFACPSPPCHGSALLGLVSVSAASGCFAVASTGATTLVGRGGSSLVELRVGAGLDPLSVVCAVAAVHF